mgnify:CR=1 FL=1
MALSADLETSSMDSPQAPRQIVCREHPQIPGLLEVAEFVTEAEEAALVAALDARQWSTELQDDRRVQHFGWRYDYPTECVHEAESLPEWLRWPLQRLEDLKALDKDKAAEMDQVRLFG